MPVKKGITAIENIVFKQLILRVIFLLIIFVSQAVYAGVNDSGMIMTDIVRVRLFSVVDFSGLEITGKNIEIVTPSGKICSDKFRINVIPGSGELMISYSNKTIRVNSTVYVRAKGPILIEAAGKNKNVIGDLIVRNTGKQIIIINTVKIDEYIAGVLSGELPQAKSEALKAQAVVARSYAFVNLKRHIKEGYNFCDSTHCQFFREFPGFDSSYYRAAKSTSGLAIVYDGKIVEGFYHSACGGKTSAAEDIFGTFSPGIVSVNDSPAKEKKPFCSDSKFYIWSCKVDLNKLNTVLKNEKLCPPGSIQSIKVSKRDRSGRVKIVELSGTGGSVKIGGYDFWQIMGSHLGWGNFASSAFEVSINKNEIVFNGSGLGHGVGMCQMGAIEMAKRGYKFNKILRHYFPKAKILRVR